MAGATPLEIGKEAPLELVGGRERMVWAIAAGMDVSSSGRGRGVGLWLQSIRLEQRWGFPSGICRGSEGRGGGDLREWRLVSQGSHGGTQQCRR